MLGLAEVVAAVRLGMVLFLAAPHVALKWLATLLHEVEVNLPSLTRGRCL
jgi:hypothetical protein